MQKHIALTLIGILLALAAIFWLQPDNSGAVFIVVLMLLLCNAVGALLLWLVALTRRSS